ncbi:Odorant-Hypothetical protein protein 56a [Nesidiocoris tenuis]|uniref:Uncharacterized protein n=1 Tax=Nesidiocoris tenuis TaxID=355587 RepID=A0ABN7AS73_9HEMI|nr:Odorant-Hypothetical protein protein 56a [Nesidiocoris tenuis]
MTPVIILLAFIFCHNANGQELPPPPNDDSRKMEILKESFLRTAKQCSLIHSTTTVGIIALMMDENSVDQDGKCFLQCMLQRYKLLNDKGSLNRDKIKTFLSYIPESAFLKSVKTNLADCSKERGILPCETSYKLIRCFYTKARMQNAAARKVPM